MVLVAAVVFASSMSAWWQPVNWGGDPDSLYYQAKVLKFRGENEQTALHELFAGPKASGLRALEEHRLPENRQFTNATWIDYSQRFFQRRLFVPLMAAAAYPVLGDRSLLDASLIGYTLLAFALFALLRRRFSPGVSAVVTCVCAVAPPLRAASFVPMTDSWSILLETCALLFALLTLERGLRWLGPWIVTLAALSITRDVTVVPLVAVGCLALHKRTRASLWLAGTGVVSVAPALLASGNTSVRENLAFVFNGSNPPRDASWSFVLHNYWPNLKNLVRQDLDYGTTLGWWSSPLWYIGLAIAAIGLVALIRRAISGDPYFLLLAYSLIGGVLFIAVYGGYSAFRQELVFLPAVAVGLAVLATDAERRFRAVHSQPNAPVPQRS